MTPEKLLKAMFKAGVDAALPSLCVPAHLPPRPKGRTVIIGGGKASGAMAKALEDAWDGPLDGVVVTRYGYRLPTERLEVVEAAHPVPDQAGREAAKRIFEAVQGLTEDDLVLALISGGGSALLAAPAEGISLEDKQAVNKALLASGATISEMNTVRKHLSAIKGGRLARAAYPAKVVALMISDVPGDDASIIASGPTVPDASTNADAIAIVEKYKIDLPPAVRKVLDTIEETPKPGDKCFERVENIMVSEGRVTLDLADGTRETAPPVADSSINRNHRPDDLIFCENEPGYELYIIQTGRVKITKMVEGQEVMLAVLQPGDIFGEMAILDNKPRTATAICAEDSSMLAINKANFENMVKAQPQLATKLITLLSERIWTAYRQLANLMINDPLGRLYDTLLTLAEKDHAKIGARASYHYDIGGKDLLSMVGFDAVKDERLLLDLLKSRWLKLDGGKIICLDLQELEKQVAFYKKKAAVERKREKAAASQ